MPRKAADRSVVPEGYQALLGDVVEQIRLAQVRAAVSVNQEAVTLYWRIGRGIATRQAAQGWGAQVIDRLAADLRRAFPRMKGFSRRNLHYMRAFAEAYPDESFVQQVVAHLPWGHNVRLLDAVKDSDERAWYARQAIQYGWSRDILLHQVDSGLYRRQGRAVTNFQGTLPAPQSDLAQQMLKDPYNFDFLDLGPEIRERDLERGLTAHIREFLLELGVGFAFVGSQYHLEVGGQDYYIDLLFYHIRLHCYVAIDLKMGAFEPSFAGMMNFYLSAVDDLLRTPLDAPSIGIILCKTKNKVVAEYALRDVSKPIGVSAFALTEALPADLRGSLPTVEELEATLGDAGVAGVAGVAGDTKGDAR